MGFFDDFGRKVADSGQKTMQKAKDLSDIVRINSLISQEEDKINNTYYQIGKLYVSIHGNDGEEEFSALINTVIELEQNVKKLKKQVQDIKGVQRCEKCGAEIPRGVAFCSSCGAPLSTVEVQVNMGDYVKCPSCGSNVKKGMRFCTVCGNPMVQLQPKPQQVDLEIESQSNEEPKMEEVNNPAEKICLKCGAKITAGMAFCVQCGTKVPVEDDSTMESQREETVQEQFCPNCGMKLDANAVFCTECGTKL